MDNPFAPDLTRRCFINAPWYDLKETYLDLFLEHGLQPEIGLEGTCLYEEDRAEFARIAALLKKHKLACTLHAPFFDLAPGALDPYILEKTRDKLELAFQLISLFSPKVIVCHLQFEDNKHGYKYPEWLSAASTTWATLVDIAARHNTMVVLENTYETSPTMHLDVLRGLNSTHAGFCLDVGHLLAFSKTSWQTWLPTLLPWLAHLHLHDNTGVRDEHLAPGRGNFNFPELFCYLKQQHCSPSVTFEPHSVDDLHLTFEYLHKTHLLDYLQ